MRIQSPLPVMREPEVNALGTREEQDRSFGALSTESGHLPLKAMDIHSQIVGLVSHMTLEQTFVNNLDQPLEATYIFPLPDRAAVTRFQMFVGDRVIEGDLKERTAARADYDQAIADGHRAAITEEERPGVFTMRVGNLMPGEEARIRLEMTGPLPYAEGEVTFQFPLVVAPRYMPGTPLEGAAVGDGVHVDTDAVPDASRISPPVLLEGYPNPVQLSLRVDVDPAGLPIANLRSSLHSIVQPDESSTSVELQPGERLNRDFILRYTLGAPDDIKTSLVLTPDEDSPQATSGTFALTVVPPVAASKAARPRSVVFVLDRSGSMGGWKMVCARRAMARMVDTLTDADTFNVYAFDNVIDTPPDFGNTLMPASNRNRYTAVEFLAKLDARGGTEMAGPLDKGVAALKEAPKGSDKILVLVTDGQVGNEDQILKKLGKRLGDIRVFTLGIDRAVNAAFLNRLATMGGGTSELVESEDRLDEVMDKLHRLIATPVLTDVGVTAKGIKIVDDTIVPRRLPDLFTGSPVLITGRYKGAPEGALEVSATDTHNKSYTQLVSGRTQVGGAIPSVWARGEIRALEDQYVLGREDRAGLESRIIETSLRYRVLCRFTAFVAIDKSEVVNAGGENHKLTQPVESPDGWSGVTDGLAVHAPAPAAPAGPKRNRRTSAGSAASGMFDMAAELAEELVDLASGSGRKGKAKEAKRAPRDKAQDGPAAILAEMKQSEVSGEDRRVALARLLTRLEALKRDLSDRGTTDAGLDELLTTVREYLADVVAPAKVADELWKKAKQALESLEKGKPVRRRPRLAFWK